MASNASSPKGQQVSGSASFPNEGKAPKTSPPLPDTGIEFDEDAILDLNPVLKRVSEANIKQASGENCPNQGSLSSPEFNARVQEHVDRIMAGARDNLAKLSSEVEQSKDEIQNLKSSFDNMSVRMASLENRYSLIKGSVKEKIMQLNFEIYQRNVINHLIESCEQMQLAAFYTTPDKRIVFTDPKYLGTDVDEAVGLTDKQACHIVDTEFGQHHYS